MTVRIKAVSIPLPGKCALDIICGSNHEKTGICLDGDPQWEEHTGQESVSDEDKYSG